MGFGSIDQGHLFSKRTPMAVHFLKRFGGLLFLFRGFLLVLLFVGLFFVAFTWFFGVDWDC